MKSGVAVDYDLVKCEFFFFLIIYKMTRAHNNLRAHNNPTYTESKLSRLTQAEREILAYMGEKINNICGEGAN